MSRYVNFENVDDLLEKAVKHSYKCEAECLEGGKCEKAQEFDRQLNEEFKVAREYRITSA